MDWKTEELEFDSRNEAANYPVLHSVQTASEAHPDRYTVSTEKCYPGSKAEETWSWPLAFN
jgi:hypothetical protein